MLKKNDICFIILLLIIIIIFIILNKKNEKMLRENFYSSQPGPSPGPSDEVNNSMKNQIEKNNNHCPSPNCSSEEVNELLLNKMEQIQITTNNEIEKIFKDRLTNQLFVNTMVNTLKKVLGKELKDKDLNEIIKFEIQENSFVITISNINGLEIINNQQLSNEIKNNMLELYTKHIPEIEKYEVVITSGSLKITLKRKEETTNPICEPTELQELESFMKMFNNSDENIIQYEPDGVSGIFAPYIKVA